MSSHPTALRGGASWTQDPSPHRPGGDGGVCSAHDHCSDAAGEWWGLGVGGWEDALHTTAHCGGLRGGGHPSLSLTPLPRDLCGLLCRSLLGSRKHHFQSRETLWLLLAPCLSAVSPVLAAHFVNPYEQHSLTCFLPPLN